MTWRRAGGGWPLLALIAATASACGAPVSGGCTQIGSSAGVSVIVEREVVVPGLTLSLRICQDHCVQRRVALQPGSVSVGQTCTSDDPDGSCSASASPDGTLVGFADVATLTAGEVRVAGELGSGTRPTELAEVRVRADPTYPNGRDCPSGAPQAAVRVTSSGLR